MKKESEEWKEMIGYGRRKEKKGVPPPYLTHFNSWMYGGIYWQRSLLGRVDILILMGKPYCLLLALVAFPLLLQNKNKSTDSCVSSTRFASALSFAFHNNELKSPDTFHDLKMRQNVFVAGAQHRTALGAYQSTRPLA